MTENALLTKLKQRYDELSIDHPWRDKLKEVIDIIEDEEKNPTVIVEEPKITIDESLLKDTIDIWFDGKLFKD